MADPGSPGRARRLWLEERLKWALHAADLVDRKRQVLLGERRRLAAELEQARADWNRSALEARSWAQRADAVGGAAEVRLLVAALSGAAELTIEQDLRLGLKRPRIRSLSLPEIPSSILAAVRPVVAEAAEAHRRALQAASACSVAEAAYGVVDAELRATERRSRALERVRVPALQSELRTLALRFDELERQERVIGRWAAAQLDRS